MSSPLAPDTASPASFAPTAPAYEARAGEAGGDGIAIGVAFNPSIDPQRFMRPDYIPNVRPDMSDLISGQKCVIWALLLHVAAFIITIGVIAMVGPLGGSGFGTTWSIVSRGLALVAWFLSMWGVYQMVHSMGSSYFFFPAMFVPVISIFALLVLNVQATGRLRSNGYKVGLLGVVEE